MNEEATMEGNKKYFEDFESDEEKSNSNCRMNSSIQKTIP